jgi:hypothetical protein
MALEPETDAWAQIRYAYEHTDQPIGDICIAHGISSGTLRDRMRRWQWKRRRPPISHEGPPAAIPYRDIGLSAPFPAYRERSAAGAERGWPGDGMLAHIPGENAPHPMSSPRSDIDLSPQAGRGNQATMPEYPASPALAYAQPADAFPPKERDEIETDPSAIVPRLRSASARVLPAIEATLARLAAGTQHPREMERASRALSALTRTLRELNALLSAHAADAARDNELPEDMDAFRDKIAQRIQSFIDARRQAEEEAKAEET